MTTEIHPSHRQPTSIVEQRLGPFAIVILLTILASPMLLRNFAKGTGSSGGPISQTESLQNSMRPDMVTKVIQVDFNSASVRELCLLPGIGPSTAEKIVDDRNKNGHFEALHTITRIPGIGPATLRRIEPYCVMAMDDESTPAGLIKDP